VDIAGGQHRAGATAQVAFVQAALEAALAVGQLPSYDRLHSKLLDAGGGEEGGIPSQTTKTAGIFEFFRDTSG
jgi:hypothetical protein